MADSVGENVCSTQPASKPASLNIKLAQTHRESVHNGDDNKSFTPKTPTSSFSSFVIDCCEGCIVDAFVLCHWDNIVGPRIRHVWKLSAGFDLSPTLLNTISIQTLNGEICRDPLDPHIDTKFFMLREKGVIISSYIFGASDHGELGVHSFSMVISSEKKKAFSRVADLCGKWIKRLVGKLKIFIDKESRDTALTLFSTQLFNLAQMLLSLKDLGLPVQLRVCDTHFQPKYKCDSTFLRKAITAHLVTSGTSVVVGPKADSVNMMIRTLALFLPADQRLRCRLVSENSFFPYHPELPVQGCIQSVEGQVLASVKDVCLSSYPTAIVNLVSNEVYITSYIHKHYLAHHRALKQELECLWREKRNNNLPTRKLIKLCVVYCENCDVFSSDFHVIDDPETLVKNLLEDMDFLTDGPLEKYIDNFIRQLEKKAFLLLKYVEEETDRGKKLGSFKRKKLRQDLSLTAPGDFKIVLAAADRLQPGIYGLLYQDRIREYVTEQSIHTVPGRVFGFNLNDSYS